METTGFSPAGFIALAVFSLDRFTKIAALKILDLGQSVRAIPGVLRITLVLNDGAAFGLFKGRAAFFVFISLAVIIAIVAYIIKSRPLNRPISIGLGLILGGALGNLADRIVLGKVVDFIDFGIWPVFNIADSCITIGAAVLVFSMLAKSSKRKA
ncbi:MAG: signal peptidase II [Candidatus Omnitrophica bacterium]|nr:signal peptidase II [Candidatus Omnitrophota bacterium]